MTSAAQSQKSGMSSPHQHCDETRCGVYWVEDEGVISLSPRGMPVRYFRVVMSLPAVTFWGHYAWTFLEVIQGHNQDKIAFAMMSYGLVISIMAYATGLWFIHWLDKEAQKGGPFVSINRAAKTVLFPRIDREYFLDQVKEVRIYSGYNLLFTPKDPVLQIFNFKTPYHQLSVLIDAEGETQRVPVVVDMQSTRSQLRKNAQRLATECGAPLKLL